MKLQGPSSASRTRIPCRRLAFAWFLIALFAPPTASIQAVRALAADPITLSGSLTTTWFDDFSGAKMPPEFVLRDDSGRKTNVILSARILASARLTGVLTANRVTIAGRLLSDGSLQAESIWRDVVRGESALQAAVSGSQPYVNIMCRFADSPADEPHPASFYAPITSAAYPYLDHYWREVSYGAVDMKGSSTASAWVTLPQPRSYYITNETGPTGNLYGDLGTDCATAADGLVYFPSYAGINMFFNESLVVSVGGGTTLTLDGTTKRYGLTMINPLHQPLGSVAHEMGHAFGLPHSSGPYGNVYDSQWDVMSSSAGRCAVRDPSFGCVPQHTIAFHKDLVGWIPASRKFTAQAHASATVTIAENSGRDATGYLLAIVPLTSDGTKFYSIETRRFAGYDLTIPGEAVLIHKVDKNVISGGNLNNSPALVVDPDGNGNPNDAGAMWTEGETFLDSANGIAVTVISTGATSATVTVDTRAQIWLTTSLTSMTFAATKAAGSRALTSATPAQNVTVAFAGQTSSWAASADRPWIQITGASGSTNGRFSVSIVNPSDAIGASTSLSGTVTVTAAGASNSPLTIPVTLTVRTPGSTTAPIGAFDTPANNATGLVGAIAVTGWSLDDVGVDRTEIWRNCVETIDRPAGRCFAATPGGPPNFVFIGRGAFLSGARPDVEALFPTSPAAYRAGWGYLMATNALPHIPTGAAQGGQGTFTLSAYAIDSEGRYTALGQKTITLDNDHATIPFGVIDTPDQGGTVPGTTVGYTDATAYPNFGWAMTQIGKCIDTASTASYRVYIDGVARTLTPGSNWFPGLNRSDIAAAYPGYCNTTTALAAYYINADALGLANGLHTIGWDVIDNQGNVAGIGSRFFIVSR